MVAKTLMAGLLAAVSTVLTPGSAVASTPHQPIEFFEEAAEAFWETPHACADGSTVQSTFLIRSTRDFEAPETEDPDPTVRLQFLAVCPDGRSYSWGAPTVPATIHSFGNLRLVVASGEGAARDIFGVTHQLTFEVAYIGVGPLETDDNGSGSVRKEREAIAVARVTFDGSVLVDGRNNHSTRPAPFIRQDFEF
jgi:hypothetical protein